MIAEFLAAKRLTRLVTEDEIARPLRDSHTINQSAKLQYLVNCPICVGVYSGAAIAVLSSLFPKTAKVVVTALALSEAQALWVETEARVDASLSPYVDFGEEL